MSRCSDFRSHIPFYSSLFSKKTLLPVVKTTCSEKYLLRLMDGLCILTFLLISLTMDMTYHLITKTKIIDCKHVIFRNRRWAKNLQLHHIIKFKIIESMNRRKEAHHSFASIFANKHNANIMVLSWGRLSL